MVMPANRPAAGTPDQRQPARAPGALRAARVIMYVQGVASALLAAMLIVEVFERFDHGQEVPALGYYASFGGAVIALVVLLSAVLIVSHRRWVRPLAMAIETIGIVNGLINLSYGMWTAGFAIVLAIVVICLLAKMEVGEWIADEHPVAH